MSPGSVGGCPRSIPAGLPCAGALRGHGPGVLAPWHRARSPRAARPTAGGPGGHRARRAGRRPDPAARPRRHGGRAGAGASGPVPRVARGPESRRRRAARRRHGGLGGLVAGRDHRGRHRDRGDRRALDRCGRRGVPRAAAAGAPRAPVAGDGLLPAEQRRGRRRRAGRAGRAGADRRLRRASRQRNPGDLLRRSARAVRLVPRVAALSRAPGATTRSATAPARARR